MRLRWYGARSLKPDQKIYVEKKVHREPWTEEPGFKVSTSAFHVYMICHAQHITYIVGKSRLLAVTKRERTSANINVVSSVSVLTRTATSPVTLTSSPRLTMPDGPMCNFLIQPWCGLASKNRLYLVAPISSQDPQQMLCMHGG